MASRRCAVDSFWGVFLVPSSRCFRRLLCEFRHGIRGNSHREACIRVPILAYFPFFTIPPSSSPDRRSSSLPTSPGGISTFRVEDLVIVRGFLFTGCAGFSDISRSFSRRFGADISDCIVMRTSPGRYSYASLNYQWR